MTTQILQSNNELPAPHSPLVSVTWTSEQLSAITTSGCDLLVAAAAGSGKTAVLVERIIRKITDEKDPIDIDRLLVVTFTNAAATEMRERVGEAIIKALERKPESRQLQRQLTLLNKASITTVHSFCLEVIRNNFHCVDLAPNFRITDETESVLLKMEALEELFEEKYQADPIEPEFIRLVECYGGSIDDRMLEEMVFNLHSFIQSAPWPHQWLEEKVEEFNLPEGLDFSETAWGKMLIDSFRIELEGFVSMLKSAEKLIVYSEGLHPYLANIQEDMEYINKLMNKCEGTWDELCDVFSHMEFSRLGRCGKDADKEKQEQVKSLRDEVKKRMKKVKDEIFYLSSLKIIQDLKQLHPLMKCLSELVIEFNKRYGSKKNEKALLDFNDLEHFCLEILTDRDEKGDIVPSKIACDFQQRFEEILIDEYQDSNMVQEVIMSAISRKNSNAPNIFMVGDVKQSIYKFRQARPELFLDKYSSYSAEEGMPERKIQLYKNFRSRKEVIDSVNFVFRQLMSRDIGELEYNADEALNLGASFDLAEEEEVLVGGPVELNIIDLKSDTEGTDSSRTDSEHDEEEESLEEEQPDNIQCEARVVAKRIKQLMQADETGKTYKVYDKRLRKYRPVEFKDIVILLRTTRNWSDIFMEELGRYGIPVYADTGTGYFKTIEIQTIMSLLQVIDNPRQDIPLLSVLRSPIVSFTPDELIDIRLRDKECSFYEAMIRLGEDIENKAGIKVQSFMQRLEGWRKKADHMSTDELVWYLYRDTGYFSFVGAMPGGEQRQANLRILFERARQFEETSYKGLFNFINFINKLKSSRGDMGSAKILGENENIVRIMSIHKSKGLEFPVVFVSGMGKQFNMQDMNKSILLHQDMGFGPEFVDHQRRIAYPSTPKQALKCKIKLESLSEEMRILYVAFTRAKEKLIITGSVKDSEKVAKVWCRSAEEGDAKLPEYQKLKARSFLDWIGPAIVRHNDGTLLREIGGMELKNGLIEDESVWNVRLWTRENLGGTKGGTEEPSPCPQEAEVTEGRFSCPDIYRRLDWQYAYKASELLPTKMSVTELKRFFNAEAPDEYSLPIFIPSLVKKPMFMEESRGLSAAEKGSAMHFAMQHLQLDSVAAAGQIEQQLMGMVSKELLTVQQAKAVNIEKIRGFFASSLGQRMMKAERISREMPFNIEIKSTALYQELEEDIYGQETILLQGMIDCFFEEQDELVLVDYKTDYIPDGNTQILKERYKVQIDYYTKALESITGKRVKEKYIYLFRNGEVIEY